MRITTRRADDTLTLELAGRLDINSAPALERALGLDGVRHLVLDLGGCPLVSSAGLRQLLRAQKQLAASGGTMLLTNVTQGVQDVLDITGFSSLIPSRRKVREISIDGLEFLSAGVCGECYRLDRETIVKLYNEGVDPAIAEKEKKFAKAAFVSGIPTAISYDVVACGSRTGVVYEMLDATLFSVLIRNDLNNLDRHADTLVEITRTVHATRADPAIFPDIKASFRGYIGQMDFFLSTAEVALLQRRLEAIPDGDGCVHFDLHTSNIMMRGDEPVIIDMGDLSRGHYLFDIGLLCTIYGLPELGISEMATKIPNADGVRLLALFLERYFSGKPDEERRLFEGNRHFLSSLRLIYTITFLPKLRDQLAHAVKELLMPRIAEESGQA
ncbi:MAG: anti-sigma factor antagonist [Alphaproteobacteria bacterium]